jgi:HD-GYP domain-containing protein (c-di-GMP phosphodiesterase class II)
VADSYDAMTTSRPYRPAMARHVAIQEIRNGALTQFDPQVVASFLEVMEESSKVVPFVGEDRQPVAAVELAERFEQVQPWLSSSP